MQEIDEELLLCYSTHLCKYIKHVEKRVKAILSKEMGFAVARTRFAINGFTYPIKVVLFEHPKKLGYFCSATYTIGVHKQYSLTQDDVEIDNLLRHELAHYYLYITNTQTQQIHGVEFRQACKKFGWSKKIYQSTSQATPKREKALLIHDKIQKLINLGESSNINEAKSALQKARALLEKYQINIQEKTEYMVTKKILWQRRCDPTIDAIASIVGNFFVVPILNRGHKGVYLELFGRKEHVEIGQYIANILKRKLPELFSNAGYKGTSMKNSFYLGLSKGFKESLSKKNQSVDKGLIAYNKQLQENTILAYPSLKNYSKKFKYDVGISNKGYEIGKALDIKSALKNAKTQACQLLGVMHKS